MFCNELAWTGNYVWQLPLVWVDVCSCGHDDLHVLAITVSVCVGVFVRPRWPARAQSHMDAWQFHGVWRFHYDASMDEVVQTLTERAVNGTMHEHKNKDQTHTQKHTHINKYKHTRLPNDIRKKMAGCHVKKYCEGVLIRLSSLFLYFSIIRPVLSLTMFSNLINRQTRTNEWANALGAVNGKSEQMHEEQWIYISELEHDEQLIYISELTHEEQLITLVS